MGWAVIETVPEYNIEGDPERKSTEFTHWIYADKRRATARLKTFETGRKVRVEEVEGSWEKERTNEGATRSISDNQQ